MKLGAYPAFTATAFQSHLAYRNQVWSGVFGQLVGTFAFIAVWTAAFVGRDSVDGVTLPQMITYVLLAGPLLNWNTTRYIREVGDTIRTGEVASHLLRPLHYPGLLLFNQLGSTAFEHVSITLPTIVIVALSVGLLPPASLEHGLLFLAYWLVSWLMLFLIASLTALLSFWLLTAFALDWFLRGVMALASGTIVPLWFMPPILANGLAYLPFAWVSYYPSAVYLGRLDLVSSGVHLAIGLAWLSALGSLLVWLWYRASRRIIVQGG